jgi:hypothetical protein
VWQIGPFNHASIQSHCYFLQITICCYERFKILWLCMKKLSFNVGSHCIDVWWRDCCSNFWSLHWFQELVLQLGERCFECALCFMFLKIQPNLSFKLFEFSFQESNPTFIFHFCWIWILCVCIMHFLFFVSLPCLFHIIDPKEL